MVAHTAMGQVASIHLHIFPLDCVYQYLFVYDAPIFFSSFRIFSSYEHTAVSSSPFCILVRLCTIPEFPSCFAVYSSVHVSYGTFPRVIYKL